MKKILLLTSAFFALSTSPARALTFLDVSFTQDNWVVDLRLEPQDLPTPFDWFTMDVDGFQFGGGGGGYFQGLLPVDYLNHPFMFPGEHTAKMTFSFEGNVTTIYGDQTFTVAAPTGDRPTSAPSVPDGGSTLGLLALGAISVLRLRAR